MLIVNAQLCYAPWLKINAHVIKYKESFLCVYIATLSYFKNNFKIIRCIHGSNCKSFIPLSKYILGLG